MRITLSTKEKIKKSKVEIPEHKYDLLECHFMPDEWKVLVTCILLNRTTRKQVERMIYGFFREFKDHEELLEKNDQDLAAGGVTRFEVQTRLNYVNDLFTGNEQPSYLCNSAPSLLFYAANSVIPGINLNAPQSH